MAMADRWSGETKARILLLLVLPVLIWLIDYRVANPHFTFCLFKNITGRDCYGCGTLRGISAAMHLDFPAVWRLNRLNVVTIPLLAWLYGKELFRNFGYGADAPNGTGNQRFLFHRPPGPF